MPQIRLKISEKADQHLRVYMVKNNIRSKQKAIEYILLRIIGVKKDGK